MTLSERLDELERQAKKACEDNDKGLRGSWKITVPGDLYNVIVNAPWRNDNSNVLACWYLVNQIPEARKRIAEQIAAEMRK